MGDNAHDNTLRLTNADEDIPEKQYGCPEENWQ